MTTIPQNQQLINELNKLLEASREAIGSRRVYEKVLWLVLGELVTFARHTISQLLLGIGHSEGDWSSWYRLFSQERFNYKEVSEVLFQETLAHVGAEELYVVAGDGSQTRRSSLDMEGSYWLHNPLSPVFKRGIHMAQRWFNGSWLLPAEGGYSRALPLQWLPAFTEKSQPETVEPRKEWECAIQFLEWLQRQFRKAGRVGQRLLMLADGSYDTVNLWQHLPEGVIFMVRSAKNRALWHLPPPDSRPNRKYGERAATPQQLWQKRRGWKKLTLQVRGRQRNLQYRVEGPFVRKGAAHRPLFLIIVRGKRHRQGRRKPLPFLVNALLSADGQWQLPLPIDQLLFWSWQRWEVEVAHRELKANFGLGHKQCWNPHAAVLSVQWSAWVYSLLLLAGYRTWGLSHAPNVPSSWWSGAPRWSLNTLWRGYRAALWGEHTFAFSPVPPHTPVTDIFSHIFQPDLRHSVFASARA